MFTVKYKGYYIHGHFNVRMCVAMLSASGIGYEWKVNCVSMHAAKLAITKHIKENAK